VCETDKQLEVASHLQVLVFRGTVTSLISAGGTTQQGINNPGGSREPQ